MKTAFFSHLLLSLYFFISLSGSLAAPGASYSYDASVNQGLLSDPGVSATSRPVNAINSVPGELPPVTPSAQYFVQWLNRHAETYNGNICFYSGKTNGTAVYHHMQVIAERLKCEWINTLLDRAHVQVSERTQWSSVPENTEWKATSRALATNARGTVKVILGETLKEPAVWTEVELPTLRKSQQEGWVTKIEMYPMDGAGELGKPVLNF